MAVSASRRLWFFTILPWFLFREGAADKDVCIGSPSASEGDALLQTQTLSRNSGKSLAQQELNRFTSSKTQSGAAHKGRHRHREERHHSGEGRHHHAEGKHHHGEERHYHHKEGPADTTSPTAEKPRTAKSAADTTTKKPRTPKSTKRSAAKKATTTKKAASTKEATSTSSWSVNFPCLNGHKLCYNATQRMTPEDTLNKYQLMHNTRILLERHKMWTVASGGTLLGAVRNKGIIPHDNDVDLNFIFGEFNVSAAFKADLRKNGMDIYVKEKKWKSGSFFDTKLPDPGISYYRIHFDDWGSGNHPGAVDLFGLVKHDGKLTYPKNWHPARLETTPLGQANRRVNARFE